jgi:hemerythrin
MLEPRSVNNWEYAMLSPDLRLGVPLMDEDHERLEQMLTHVPSAPDSELVRRLAEIEVETRAHFAREEALMRTADVPIMDCHIALHEHFLRAFAEAHEPAAAHDLTRLRHFLETTLPQMFAQHVDTADRATASFLRM